VTPDGRLSEKETLVAATVPTLAMVNVSRDVVPTGIELGEKALAKLSPFAVTMSVAGAEVAFPISEVTVTGGLTYVSGTLDVTSKESSHVDCAGTLPFVMLTAPPFGTAVTRPRQPGVMLKLIGLANVTPEGRLSVNSTFLARALLELVMVNVRRDVVPTRIVVGEKALAKLSGDVTVSVA